MNWIYKICIHQTNKQKLTFLLLSLFLIMCFQKCEKNTFSFDLSHLCFFHSHLVTLSTL